MISQPSNSLHHLILFYSLSIYHSLFYCILKYVLGNDFGKYTKNCGFKMDTLVAFYDKQDVSSKFVSSARIFGSSVTVPDEFQRRLHSVGFSRESGPDFIVLKGYNNLKRLSPAYLTLKNSPALRWMTFGKPYETCGHIWTLYLGLSGYESH